MILDIVLDDIYFDNVLPQIIVLDISNLRIFVSLLHKITEMIFLHLFNYLYQSIIECSRQICLLLIFPLQISEFLDITTMFSDHNIAKLQDLHNLLINWLILILGKPWQLVSFASNQAGSTLNSLNLTSLSR